MLVHELIEALNAMPPDWPVVFNDSEWGAEEVSNARPVELYTSGSTNASRNVLIPAIAVDTW